MYAKTQHLVLKLLLKVNVKKDKCNIKLPSDMKLLFLTSRRARRARGT